MMPSNRDEGDDLAAGARSSSCSLTASGVRMHRCLLYLQPRCAEQEYYGQLEALDLVNCIIAPLFFANALAMWTRGLLSTVYCIVLLIKGYQVALLLLPNACSCGAHRRARYWLILSERCLRQFIATPLLGRGPRFIEWLHKQAAADASLFMFCLRLLLLMSGFTISFWNAFCLPLDFPSQLAVTSLFWLIHFPPNVTQIAFAFQNIQQQLPRTLMLQLAFERGLSRLLRLLLGMLTPVAAAAQQLLPGSSGGGDGSAVWAFLYCEESAAAAGAISSSTGLAAAAVPAPSSPAGASVAAAAAAATAACIDPLAAAAVPPGRAPDVSSLAGRAILATSSAYMLFAVLLLPIYITWRVERHLKSKWMATLPTDWLEQQQQRHQDQQQQQGEQEQRHQQQERDTDGAAGTTGEAAAAARRLSGVLQQPESGSSSSKASSSDGDSSNSRRDSPVQQQMQQQQQGSARAQAGRRWLPSQLRQLQQRLGPQVGSLLVWLGVISAGSSCTADDCGSFVYPPAVFDILPSSLVLARHMGLMLLVSVAFGEVFVLLCMLVPSVAGLLWKQIIY